MGTKLSGGGHVFSATGHPYLKHTRIQADCRDNWPIISNSAAEHDAKDILHNAGCPPAYLIPKRGDRILAFRIGPTGGDPMVYPPQHDPARTVPVILDGLVREGPIGLARCTYFSIAADEPLSGWQLGLGTSTIPFLMLGLQGIIVQPANGIPEFIHPDLLDDLVHLIEQQDGLSVEFEYLWLPDVLVERAWSASSEARETGARRPPRGSLFRVGATLFATAFRVARDGTDFYQLGFAEERVGDAEGSVLRYSPTETRAVRRWSRRQAQENANFDRSDELG